MISKNSTNNNTHLSDTLVDDSGNRLLVIEFEGLLGTGLWVGNVQLHLEGMIPEAEGNEIKL